MVVDVVVFLCVVFVLVIRGILVLMEDWKDVVYCVVSLVFAWYRGWYKEKEMGR